MEREQIRQSLEGIFRSLFKTDQIDLQDSTTAEDVDGWDSLTHAYLILAIEKKLGVKFFRDEIAGFRNVGDLIRSIQSHQSHSE